MFIEVNDSIRRCPMSVNVDIIEGFYSIEYFNFEEYEWLYKGIVDGRITAKTVLEIKNESQDVKIFIEESYKEIRGLLKVHGCYSK